MSPTVCAQHCSPSDAPASQMVPLLCSGRLLMSLLTQECWLGHLPVFTVGDAMLPTNATVVWHVPRPCSHDTIFLCQPHTPPAPTSTSGPLYLLFSRTRILFCPDIFKTYFLNSCKYVFKWDPGKRTPLSATLFNKQFSVTLSLVLCCSLPHISSLVYVFVYKCLSASTSI